MPRLRKVCVSPAWERAILACLDGPPPRAKTVSHRRALIAATALVGAISIAMLLFR